MRAALLVIRHHLAAEGHGASTAELLGSSEGLPACAGTTRIPESEESWREGPDGNRGAAERIASLLRHPVLSASLWTVANKLGIMRSGLARVVAIA
jgi:hypothetical protein